MREASGGLPPDGGAEWRDAATGQTGADAPDGLFAADAPPSFGEGADGHSPEEAQGSAVPSEDAPVDSTSNSNPFDIF